MAMQPWHYNFNAPFSWRPDRDLVAFKDLDSLNKPLTPILNIDLVEGENDFHVHADMPGVKESDLEVNVVEDSLIIKGHRERSYDVENSTSHRVERSFGTVQRAIRLPANADKSRVSATFENGVLSVTFPKCEPTPSAVKIPINVAK